MLTQAEAITLIREDLAFEDLVRDSYLDADIAAAAARFTQSAEFAETRLALRSRIGGAVVLDVGAGAGIASFGFATAGADRVFALEPDTSDEAGCRAQVRLIAQTGITFFPISGFAECMPLAPEAVDIVYARQALHHFSNLFTAVRECARVLKPGGTFIACREHVVDSDEQLQQFLVSHPVHRLTGGEGAWPLAAYIGAIEDAGLILQRSIGPWDSLINAYPSARRREDLTDVPRRNLLRRMGRFGAPLGFVPGLGHVARALMTRRRVPGRLYSFVALKP